MSDNMQQETKELFEMICSIDNEKDCENFFSDLCTYNEIQAMAQRLKAAKLLLNNETYEQVIAKTDISSATLSRVSKCIKLGTGYKTMINKNN